VSLLTETVLHGEKAKTCSYTRPTSNNLFHTDTTFSLKRLVKTRKHTIKPSFEIFFDVFHKECKNDDI
jgi:hypothetical protein